MCLSKYIYLYNHIQHCPPLQLSYLSSYTPFLPYIHVTGTHASPYSHTFLCTVYSSHAPPYSHYRSYVFTTRSFLLTTRSLRSLLLSYSLTLHPYSRTLLFPLFLTNTRSSLQFLFAHARFVYPSTILVGHTRACLLPHKPSYPYFHMFELTLTVFSYSRSLFTHTFA